jgi:hypothetical protein
VGTTQPPPTREFGQMRVQSSPGLLEHRAATLLHAAAEHLRAALQVVAPDARSTLDESLDLCTRAMVRLAAPQGEHGVPGSDGAATDERTGHATGQYHDVDHRGNGQSTRVSAGR